MKKEMLLVIVAIIMVGCLPLESQELPKPVENNSLQIEEQEITPEENIRGLGPLCSGQEECISFCQDNQGECEHYCQGNHENNLCKVIFPAPEEERIVSILERTKENLRVRGIDCSFENDHTTKNSLAIDPQNTNTLYVGIEGKGIYKSTDGGITWSKKSKGIIAYPDEKNLAQLCPPDPNKIIIDPTNTQRLLLSPGDISTGYIDWPYGETGGVWESVDGAESWHQILKENLNAAGTSLALDPQHPQTIYFGVNSDPATFDEAPIKEALNTKGVIYKTTDSGNTWEELKTGMLPGLQASGIFVNPQNSQHIVLLTQAHDHQYFENYIQEIFSHTQFGPMTSMDGGKTWTKLAENLPAPFRDPFDGDVSIHNFDHMIVRPFLFGEEFPSDTSQKSFYSVDGGMTFAETPVYINIGRYDPHDEEGNHLLGYAPWYADGDLVESFDAGATWRSMGQAVEIDNTNVKVTNFVWDPKNPEIVYMSGTQGYVWKSADGGKSWTAILNLDKISSRGE